ncbi:MAG: hypothetical protein R6V01_09260 [Thermoplasmatota archaeon]
MTYSVPLFDLRNPFHILAFDVPRFDIYCFGSGPIKRKQKYSIIIDNKQYKRRSDQLFVEEVIIIELRGAKTAAGKIRELTGTYYACTKDNADVELRIEREKGPSLFDP